MAMRCDKVRHFSTGQTGVVKSIKQGICLIVFGDPSYCDVALYRQSEIGYADEPGMFLILIDDNGNDLKRG